jgi:WD40 repeat protein
VSTAVALVAGAVHTLDDYPTDLAWSPESDALVVGGGEGALYRVGAGAQAGALQLLGRHDPGVLGLAWQPHGTLLASSGQDGSVRLWDSGATGADAKIVHRGVRWPAGLAFRADGQRLAFAAGKDLLVLDAGGGLLATLTGHSCPLSHLHWRGRDELIAVGNGALFVDRPDAGGKVTQYVIEGTPLTLALSADMKVAACGLADGSVNFRYLNNQKRSRMSGYEGKVDQTVWSANSRYLATSSTGATSIVIWDFGGRGPEGSDPWQLAAHEERIDSLAWQGTGPYLASAGRDWRVVLWRPGPAAQKPLDIQLLDGPAGLARWSPDGKQLAVVQPSGKLRLYALRVRS